MSDRVLRSLSHAFERWDGKGRLGLSQQDIDPHTRIVQVAHFAEVHHLAGRPLHAIEIIACERGGWFDPDIADAFLHLAAELLAHVEADSVWDAALAAEPGPRPRVGPSRVDEICAAFADLKSPWSGAPNGGRRSRAMRPQQAVDEPPRPSTTRKRLTTGRVGRSQDPRRRAPALRSSSRYTNDGAMGAPASY